MQQAQLSAAHIEETVFGDHNAQMLEGANNRALSVSLPGILKDFLHRGLQNILDNLLFLALPDQHPCMIDPGPHQGPEQTIQLCPASVLIHSRGSRRGTRWSRKANCI